MNEFQIPRERMVKLLREHYKIRDERVLEVMRNAPRHLFVSDALQAQAYKDNALPISAKQTISQPFIVARMSELLELDSSSSVLEIGAGSGYQTLILAYLARQVFAIERIPQLAEKAWERLQNLNVKNVILKYGDGTNGWKEHAPYDGILVAAGSPKMPEPLLDQLKIGGKLIIPISENQKSQKLMCVKRTLSGFQTEDFGACAFVPLIGKHGWSEN